jgi:para-nitrobenzyl esterase
MTQSRLSRRAFLASSAFAAIALQGGIFCASSESAPVSVLAPCGRLSGKRREDVNIFRGVPFAEPPVGALRFRAPVKAKSWIGERDATRFAAAAMQPEEHNVAQSEDCLYLNVWAPQGKGPFPVYVWIHGGGFTGGYSFEPMYDGTGLARAGVICVTVAYRLGVFGFLDLEPLLGATYAGSANNGLRDLMQALTWVRENIAAFGGDPTQVTVGGQSAGAKLTDILLGIPSAQPLFKQAISQSGGAERVASRKDNLAVSHGFGEEWHARSAKNSELLTASATALIEAQKHFVERWPKHFPLRAEIDGVLIPRLPVETIAAGSAGRKRLLIGTNRDESASFIGPHPASDPGSSDLGNLAADKFWSVLHKYRAVYPELSEEQLRIRATTAEEYWIPSVRVADAFVKGGGKAWMYRFDYPESSGWLRGFAHHTLEVHLVWSRPSAEAGNAKEERDLARDMHQAWIAFLRGETPASSGLPDWPEYRIETRATMAFDAKSRVEQYPQDGERRLWDGRL